MKIFISGQKYLGEQVLSNCVKDGHEVVGVCCPLGDKYIGRRAAELNIPIIEAGFLSSLTMPKGVDLGVTAHSFDYIGKKTRYSTKLGWVGFHPSILPRHRGRSSIEWTLRMKDFVTGGTVFWLNSGIDRGDIYQQKIIFTPNKYLSLKPREASKMLWLDILQGMGEEMLRDSINRISRGEIVKMPQNKEFSSWEPRIEAKDIYNPDALMLPEKCK